MTPGPTRLPSQGLRLAAALLVVVLVVLLGSLGSRDRPPPEYSRYVAFGDSFTAAPFVPVTDVAFGCLRSSNNYPHQVASALGIRDLEDRSCTGAQTADLTRGQLTAPGVTVPAQLGGLTPQTDLVTIGIGFNNGRVYGRMATVCRRLTGICRLDDERGLLLSLVDRLHEDLVPVLDRIKEIAPRARVLLVGYPRLLPARGDCPRLPRMRPQDRETFRAVNLELRRQMSLAAKEADVEFLDFYAASLGHDVCSRVPWVQGRRGDRQVAAALHPLPAGQAALAGLIEDVLRRPPPRDR